MAQIRDGLSGVLKYFYLYLSIIGLISFSCFICQEAIQIVTFANFSCSDTRRYDLLKKNIEKIAEINDHLRALNAVLLIMQPFQYIAYSDYCNGTQSYIETLQAEVLANDPGLYAGEQISIDFYYKSLISDQRGFVIKSGKLLCILATKPQGNPVRITGVVRRISANLAEIVISPSS